MQNAALALAHVETRTPTPPLTLTLTLTLTHQIARCNGCTPLPPHQGLAHHWYTRLALITRCRKHRAAWGRGLSLRLCDLGQAYVKLALALALTLTLALGRCGRLLPWPILRPWYFRTISSRICTHTRTIVNTITDMRVVCIILNKTVEHRVRTVQYASRRPIVLILFNNTQQNI